MADFKVTPESLRTAAQALSAESRTLAATIAGLEQEVGRLQANWDGTAKQAYAEAQRSWTVTIGDMTELLGRIATATDDMAEGYVSADNSSAARFTHPA